MMKAAKPAAARPAQAAPAASAPEDGRLKLQAFAGTRAGAAPRANWELRALGAVAFELASARG